MEAAVLSRLAGPEQKVTDNPGAPNRQSVEWILNFGAFRRPVFHAEKRGLDQRPRGGLLRCSVPQSEHWWLNIRGASWANPTGPVIRLDGCFHPWYRSLTMTLWQAAGENHHPGSLVNSRSTVRLSNPLERCCPDTLHSGREPAVSPRYLLLQQLPPASADPPLRSGRDPVQSDFERIRRGIKVLHACS